MGLVVWFESSLRLSARLLGTGNLVAFGSWEIFPDAPPDTAYSGDVPSCRYRGGGVAEASVEDLYSARYAL